jgi:hypothetical protein
MSSALELQEVEKKVITLRNQQVILDRDVAVLYAVTTKAINQAVKNNPEKFPTGYIFTLSEKEKIEVVKNFDHLTKLKFSPQLPKAFTEKGLYMLATILKGNRATETTISIIETYARIKHLTKNLRELTKVTDEKKRDNLIQKSGELIAEVLDADLAIDESETTIELNFAVLKFKHTIKKKKDKESNKKKQ